MAQREQCLASSEGSDGECRSAGSQCDEAHLEARQDWPLFSIAVWPDTHNPVVLDVYCPATGPGEKNNTAILAIACVRDDVPQWLDLVLRYRLGVRAIKQKSFVHEYEMMRDAWRVRAPISELVWNDPTGT